VSYRVRVAPQASRQIREAARWWIENRPKAPNAFGDDLEAAFRLLNELPSVGERVIHSRLQGLRRLLVTRIRYHVYYAVDRETRTVEILALWHTGRGTPPRL
jgi:plasmid stabilization system protein ParE